LNIVNVYGDIIYSGGYGNTEIKLNIKPGIYIVNLFNKQEKLTKRFVVL
ncbi:MAG: T9SS type A sorting domain-containing protein, partial [Bacteroidia bacterium]|nr:T9SS type A sorting domain-containing protein [Bacteroidia bacterium]